MNVIILSPDSIRKPFGGLGVYLQETLKRFPAEYHFIVEGPATDAPHRGSNYTYVNDIRTINMSFLQSCKVIHAMDANTFKTGVQLKTVLGIPLICHIHLSEAKLCEDLASAADMFMSPVTPHAGLELFGLRHADHIIHVSAAYANRFNKKPNVSIVHNGIDRNQFQRTLSRHVQLPGNPTNRKLLFIGRFTAQKGLHNLLETRLPSNVNMYFIGGGLGTDPTISRALNNYLKRESNAFYMGQMWGEDKLSVLQQCDGMIVPSIHEPFGIVALEALASNCLLISSYADGMQDFLRQDYALYCGKEPGTIQKALNQFATMSQQQLNAMKVRAQSILPHFTWENAVNRINNIYNYLTTQNHEQNVR
ncbi:MAG: glycosyltransferase family 4 protein [Balneolales bacterium]|nr:glycosyltransferase family 4 protein [Balneolales bacterium]